MSVSSNNDELRAALNRRLAKRAHKDATKPPQQHRSIFGNDDGMSSVNSTKSESRPSSQPPNRSIDKRASSPPTAGMFNTSERKGSSTLAPANEAKRSSTPAGLRWFSKGSHDQAQEEEQGELSKPRTSSVTEQGSVLSVLPKSGSHRQSADSSDSTQPPPAEEARPRQLPRTSSTKTRSAVDAVVGGNVAGAANGDEDGDARTAKASIAGVHMEGYLSKLSSGTVKRWQKRYFILEGGYLGYLKAPGPADLAKKTFDLSKASNVEKAESDDPNSADFNLIYNENVYNMRAPSVGEMRKWMNSIQIVIAATYNGGRGGMEGASEVDRMSDSAPSSREGILIENNNKGVRCYRRYYSRSLEIHRIADDEIQFGSVNTEMLTEEELSRLVRFFDVEVDFLLGLGGSSASVGRMNSVSSPKPVTSSNMPSTIWEFDTERLDRMFEEEWFDVVEELKDGKCDKDEMAVSTSKMIDGVTRCGGDLYATLAKMDTNAYTTINYDDAHIAIENRIKSSSEAKDQCLSIVQEYMQRLAGYINKWLDIRAQWKMHESHGESSGLFSSKSKGPIKPMAAPVLSSDFPALLEAVARLRSEIDKLFSMDEANSKVKCTCAIVPDPKVTPPDGKRDSVSLRTRKKAECPVHNGPYQEWRRQLEAVLQRLGSELETAVIEELDKQLQTTNVWEPKCQGSLGEGVHGPKLILDRGQYYLTTSWTPHLLKIIRGEHKTSQEGMELTFALGENQLSELPPLLKKTFLQGRLMKNRVARTTSAINHKKGIKGKASAALGKAKRTSQKYTYSGSSSAAQQAASSPVDDDESPDPQKSGGSSSKGSIPPLDFMVAFSNEAGMISSYCGTTADDLNSRRTPETQVYGACMAGLSKAFGNLAQETGHHIAEVYFKPKYKSVISKAFNKDRLMVRVETPMTESVRNAGAFAQQLKEQGATEATNSYAIRGVLDVIVSGYIKSLCENKPKLDRFPKLPDVMAADEALVVDYFTNHKVGALDRTDVNKCIEINATIRSFLTDNDINLLMVHYLEATRLVGASKAKKIAKAVVSMRSAQWNKKQRSDILKQLTRSQGGATTMSSDESP
ncbi:hypothetical protein FOL47_000195 [Perkinsus chesapeaki]|uniref:PH domain-containing protein n=1 Tax=Perkinsus chesapeaki TaxID=330153 RepID=A0A7J6MMU1_PERCH|nr:hypothetical protein FOL47_000195 [Perkinsus chesapeaki]